MKKSLKIVIPILLILGAGGFLLTAFASGNGKEHETFRVRRDRISGSIEESGDIEGETDYTYYAQVSAPVSMMGLKVGDVVNKGDKLLTYDVTDYERTVSQASISRQQSEDNAKGQIEQSDKNQSRYNKAVADDQAYSVLYYLERESANSQNEAQYSENWNIQCERDSISKEIAKKQGEVGGKEAELATTEDPERAQTLSKEISDLNKQIGDLQSGYYSLAPAQLSPEEYANLNDTNNVMEDITRNWTQSKTQKNAYEATILNASQKEALNKQTELAQSKEDAAMEDLSKASMGVVADFQGVVTECNVKEGSVVAKGTPLFKIVGTEDMKVTVMISKYDIGSVKKGQRAEVSIAGKVYPATVSRINHVATEDDSDKAKVAVDVHIDEPDEDLILGLEADVTIYTDELMGVLVIPYGALYSDDGGDYCYVISDGVIAKQYVTAGVSTNEYAEIKEGLKEDDIVITDAVTDDLIGDKASEAVH